MKKQIGFIMTMVLGAMLLAGCGSNSSQSNGANALNQASASQAERESRVENVNNMTQASSAENENHAEETETKAEETIQTTEDVNEEQTEAADSTDAQTGKVLVVYYSASGNTKAVGDAIAQYTDADTFEIIPVNAYTDEDLDWTQDGSRVNLEHEDESMQDIELVSTTVDNFDSYDTVFIGYPIWWHEAAWVVNRFVKDNDFTGKTVIPFCTSSSSDLGESGIHLAEIAGTGDWQEGMRLSGSAMPEAVLCMSGQCRTASRMRLSFRKWVTTALS